MKIFLPFPFNFLGYQIQSGENLCGLFRFTQLPKTIINNLYFKKKKNQRKSQTIGITMKYGSEFVWSFITPPSLEPQIVTLKPKIVSSLSFNTSNSHSSEAEWGSIGWLEKKCYIHRIFNKGPSTNHGHLPHHFCFNLCIFSFGFCLVFETSWWVFVLLLILVFL